MTQPACARGVRQRARAHGLARGSRDTKHCIMAEGQPLCHNTAQPWLRYGAVMHHDMALGAATNAVGHTTRCIVRILQGLGRDTNFVS